MFKEKTIHNLSKMDYNFQKDAMEYNSPEIKEKLEMRKKFSKEISRKIEEVKDYSMKIIEVILNQEESDEEDSE